MEIPVPKQLWDKDIKQVEIIPKPSSFHAVFVYEENPADFIQVSQSEKTMSIDLGLNNLATCVTNGVIEPFIIDGRRLKSINAFYNKRKAKMQSKLSSRGLKTVVEFLGKHCYNENMITKLVSISEAAEHLGVSTWTLRRWEREGRLLPDERTKGGQRRYRLSSLNPFLSKKQSQTRIKTLGYARVSSNDQKDDLERQKQMLEMYCASQGWQFEIISDLGSGINYNKKGLKIILNAFHANFEKNFCVKY